MYDTIRALSAQFPASIAIVNSMEMGTLADQGYNDVYLAGMGGSALPGDLVNDYFGAQMVRVVRDYQVPSDVDSDSLVISASFSGNTEETIAALWDAREKGAQTVVMTNGGKLAKIAEDENIPFIKIPDCVQPRFAAGHFLTSIVMLLDRLNIVKSQENTLIGLSEFLGRNMDDFELRGRELAGHLVGRVPVIYAPETLAGTARVMKIMFNENAKVQSFHNVFPELNHNEMVGYTRMLMPATIIYVKPADIDQRIERRMDVMERVLDGKVPVTSVDLRGVKPIGEDIFEALLVTSFATYFLATEHYGIDPAPVAMVEEFKGMLVAEE